MNPLRRAFTCILLFGLISSFALAQSDTERAAKSGEVVDKIRQLDLMNHILPIIYTKEQLNLMLPAIEKARQNVKTTQEGEYKILVQIEAKVSADLDKSINEGTLPGKQMIIDLDKVFSGMDDIRMTVGKDNEDLVWNVMKGALNSGQLKAAANSVDPHAINPSLITEKMSEEEKVRFYIRNILLDPLAYPLLVKLSRSAATPSK